VHGGSYFSGDIVAHNHVSKNSYKLLGFFMQEQFLQLWQQDPASGAYNTPWGIRLQGRLDSAALQYAISLLAERHLVSRCPNSQSSFSEMDGQGPLHKPQHIATCFCPTLSTKPSLTFAGAAHKIYNDCRWSAASDSACLCNPGRDSHSHEEWKSAHAAACCWWRGSHPWHQLGRSMAGGSGPALRLVQRPADTHQGTQCAAHVS
jgi:hypothetical protein